jgi:vacuolar-type H+-ATPase subunit H
VEDKVLEEIQFQQKAAKHDSNSPLFLIREKEMEMSGRVLAAKQEAERTVAEGRRKAAEIISKAETEAEAMARDHEVKRIADAEKEAATTRAALAGETAPLDVLIAERHDKAVAAVVEIVSSL